MARGNPVAHAQHPQKRSRKRHYRTRPAQESSSLPAEAYPSLVPGGAVEFAGNVGTRSPDPCDPSSPLQLDADFDWLADTGATSHMTPHRHWIRNYEPCRIPVRLADHSTVYAVGMGTVAFDPVIGGKKGQNVEFSRVLHVPDLRSNLLSCLYLTRVKGLIMVIDSTQMRFFLSSQLLFTASIHSNNSATLDGSTFANSESASFASTLPLDLLLLHCRLCHHNYADLRRLISGDLASGISLTSKDKPDPVCEPCLAGKMTSNPFPTTHHRASRPLELVHTDLHGPMPTATHDGYRYWIVFVDDHTRFRTAMLLKRKSNAFDAFRQYKAWAENQLGLKIKALQDDKGGEYMSSAFLRFTDGCGIERRHTTRNRP